MKMAILHIGAYLKMIESITIHNGIKHKDVTYEFKKGSTLICGPNGAGKSLIQEFIRFALFGSSALRGKVSDYPADMKVTLTFKVKGNTHKVERSMSDCSFDGKVFGTKPCNKAIIECLGYNIDVFDMGNCAKQFEITSLGRMRASDRKSAIDQLIGIDIVDKIIKRLNEEKKSKKSYLEGWKAVLVEPKEPEKPEGGIIEDLHELDYRIKKVEATRLEYDTYKSKRDEIGWYGEEPKWEGEVPQYSMKDVSAYEARLNQLEGLHYEEPRFVEQFDLIKEWSAHQQWDNWVAPTMTQEEIDEYNHQWSKYKAWKNGSKVTCPQCGKEFVAGIEECEEPEISEVELKEQQKRINTTPTCDKPAYELTKDEYESEVRKYKNNQEYDKIKFIIDSYDGIDCQRVRDYAHYEYLKGKWDNFNFYDEKVKETEKDLVDSNTIDIWRKQYRENLFYQTKITEYQTQLSNYQEKLDSCEKMKEEINKLERQVKGLMEFKRRVKLSVLPSLSKVATQLAHKMSDGEIKEVVVDDDFNILVDSREIRTFSGSEEAIANLAIKLGLSSVLTRKVFNVFIGDEIDASMSEERAERVCNSLNELKSQIDQIILISHRGVECDNEIHLCR